jgi:hypothetical protein
MRRRMTNPWAFRAYLAAKLPLALLAGLRLRRLDEAACTVSLPGGWRTRNPFASTYFAAHLLAAEMATGAPAMVLVAGAPASVALILREVRAVFLKRLQGEGHFTFDDVAGMRAAVERAAAGTESEGYTGRPVGRAADGTVVSEFEISWSFKRRG